MQHSIKVIGENYEALSVARKEKLQFSAIDFFQFAKDHAAKYSVIVNGDDLLVSTWHSDALIVDYKKTIK